MKLYFNNIGVLTNVDISGDALRQGSVGIELEAIFSDISNIYYAAKFNLTRSDGSKISNVIMNMDSTSTTKFKYKFDDAWFFAKAGQTTLTVFLYNGAGTVVASGQYQFNIESSDYDDEPEITIEQYNSLLYLIASKLNIANGIIVVENLASENATNYQVGQLLYSKNAFNGQHFYKVEYSSGTGYVFVKKTFEEILNDIDEININENGVINFANGGVIKQVDDGGFAYYPDAEDDTKFVIFDANGNIEFSGSKMIRGSYEYTMPDESGTLQLHKTTLEGYGITDAYTKEEANTELAKKVDKTTTASQVYATNYQGNQTTIGFSSSASGTTIALRDSSGHLNVALTPTANNHATSKKYVDDNLNLKADKSTTYTKEEVNNIVDTIQSGEIVLVDTSIYITLNDFLATDGEEGSIYLYPIDTSDLSKGYYRYVWETVSGTPQWVSLGTTEIDLSGYYTSSQVDTLLGGYVAKSTTIAGISLTSNINAQDLTNALVFATDSDIESIMED